MSGGGNEAGHLLCVLPFPEPKAALERIRRDHPRLKVTYKQSGATEIPDEEWKDVTTLATLVCLPSDPKLASGLEFLQVFKAGVNQLWDHPIYKDSKVPICSSSGIHGPTIAEWVILTSLVASRRYNIMHDWQKERRWRQYGESMFTQVSDNVGQRLGVLGYGSIGRQVARMAKSMGMDVIAYTAGPRNTPESKKDCGYIVPGTGDPDGEIPSAWYSGLDRESLHRFLAQDIDQLLISVPLTESTMHLLGKDEFEILSKRNAFVTNIARGEIIVQDDLVHALQAFESDSGGKMRHGRKGLRGAALDVTDPEPLPSDSKLWDTPNIIITPHMSAASQAYVDRCFDVLEINLKRRDNGERLLNIVDREKGY